MRRWRRLRSYRPDGRGSLGELSFTPRPQRHFLAQRDQAVFQGLQLGSQRAEFTGCESREGAEYDAKQFV
jgi:hypothetical protein